jgi:uncharacterized SAM-binding protein YcdF (DUF218 family)
MPSGGSTRPGLVGEASLPFDALVLLGCRVEEGALLPPAARRVARAALAYEAGLSTRIVVSGGRAWAGSVEADVFARELVRRGVPESALLLEGESRSTRENARYTERLVSPLGIRRVGLVSCDFHLPRALFCFRRVGLEAEAIAATSPPLPFGRRTLRQLRELGSWALDGVFAGR